MFFFRAFRELYEQRFSVQDQRIEILEARITNLDNWVTTIAQTRGLGAPVPLSGEPYTDEREEIDDPEADMSFGGMMQEFQMIDHISSEEEATDGGSAE